MTKRKYLLLIFALILTTSINGQDHTYKPWTYWWWMGSAVNKTDITTQLQAFSNAGLGGVHIIPIYGVKGYESSFLPFLSESWLEIVQFTIQEAEKLDLGVDVTLGTGWPYGGNWIDSQHAAQRLFVKRQDIGMQEQVVLQLDSFLLNNDLLKLLAVFATNEAGKQINLTPRITDSKLYHILEKDSWKLTYFGIKNTKQLVKRAAPGGEGLVMDYFNKAATEKYLHHFDSVLTQTRFPIPVRAYYHDSYETYGADWTLDFVTKFHTQHGYALTDFLYMLTDTLNHNRQHLIHDIRETLSELLYTEFASTWTAWSKSHHKMTRYQAHGSPGNLLDLYALADIPETESFGCSNFSIPKLNCDPDYAETRFGRPNPLMMKFASSPAHLHHKPLVSAETGTWLANHFKVSLQQIKPQVDELFIAGINHIFYHGSTYSPQSEGFPGWLFYASTNFGYQSHFWEEMPHLNQYITNVQKTLQNTTPDNDILLYFPIHDLWTNYAGNLLLMFDVHQYANWFSTTNFGKTAQWLWENGYSFDYVSDKQLLQLQVNKQNQLSVDLQSTYSTILVPEVDYINTETLTQLENLANQGASIIFINQLPSHYAGLQAHINQDSGLSVVKQQLWTNKNVKVSNHLANTLTTDSIRQEVMKLKGLSFIRKRKGNDYYYFVSNLSDKFYRDSLNLSIKRKYVQIIDPQNNTANYIPLKENFSLSLPPGKSCFLKVTDDLPQVPLQQEIVKQDTLLLRQQWKVEVNINDTINLFKRDTLDDWTTWGNEALQYFCGKATYQTTFTLKKTRNDLNYQLLFDGIRETATVFINGVNCGTIWTLPYQLTIPPGVLKKKNRISIQVQNVSANAIKRIDMQKKNWKKFYDINFVDIQYKPFDASNWAFTPAGLIGNVYLITTKSE